LVSAVPVAHTSPKANVITLDGAFIVQTRKPGITLIFEDYADQVSIPFILSYLRDVYRIDVVWDSYKIDSVKHDTRELSEQVTCIGRKKSLK
jgi:hypothetical protein